MDASIAIKKKQQQVNNNNNSNMIWHAFSKPPQGWQGPDPRPLWLLVGAPAVFGPELAYRQQVAQGNKDQHIKYVDNCGYDSKVGYK